LRRRGAGRYSVIDPDGSVLYYPPRAWALAARRGALPGRPAARGDARGPRSRAL